MSTDRAPGIESTGPTVDALHEQLQQLQRRVDALENENDRLHSELEKTRKQQQEDRHTLARENHELRKANDQLRERVDRAEDSRGHIIEDIVDVEEQLDNLEAGSAGSKGGGDAPETTMQQPDLTPIERISMMDAEDTEIDMTPSIKRAVAIFDHWENWSEKTPKGRVLKSNLKTLLRTATGEQLAWRQAYRAAEALEELSKGRIEFVDHSRHGKMLIQPQPARSGHCQSSSAVAT